MILEYFMNISISIILEYELQRFEIINRSPPPNQQSFLHGGCQVNGPALQRIMIIIEELNFQIFLETCFQGFLPITSNALSGCEKE